MHGLQEFGTDAKVFVRVWDEQCVRLRDEYFVKAEDYQLASVQD